MLESFPTVSIQRVSLVWDRAEHNAFTDITLFNSQFWLVFREANTHVSGDGIVIVLKSSDGIDWQLAAELTMPDVDLRDPKIVVTPDQQLLITCAGVIVKPERGHQTFLYYSPDGYQWSEPRPVGAFTHWIWRTRFFAGLGYGVAYKRANETAVLYRLQQGQYTDWVNPLFSKQSHGLGYPNEHDLFSLPGNRMGCLLRRDADTASAQLGISAAPYREWRWHDLAVRIGGPVVLNLSAGENRPLLLASVRLYDPVRTSLCWLDVEHHQLLEILSLPSGGDTSYAGLVAKGGTILCSYYSSHEGKASIYIAELSLIQ